MYSTIWKVAVCHVVPSPIPPHWVAVVGGGGKRIKCVHFGTVWVVGRKAVAMVLYICYGHAFMYKQGAPIHRGVVISSK